MATAAVIGLVGSVILALAIGASSTFFGLVVAYGTAIVTGLGLALAVILDAISQARAKTIEATKLEG